MVVDSNPYGKLDEKHLLQFEKKIKGKLPLQYRNFLFEHNGGKLNPNYIDLPDGDGTFLEDHFYGLHAGPYPRLDLCYKMFKGRVPPETLTIAGDIYGNQILLKYNGTNNGCVFFWDHECEGEENALMYLAPDFDSFLNSVHADPDETELERILRLDDVGAMEALIENGFDIEQADECDLTILEEAAIYGKIKLFEHLYQRGAQLKNSKELALKNNHGAIVSYIDSLK